MTANRPPRIVVVGSSNTDLVIACDQLPGPGETMLGGPLQQHPGGKGANQAVAAARAGADVTFVGARGEDAFGRAARAVLDAEGIRLRHFRVKPEISSGVALILLGGRRRENLIAVAESANSHLSGTDVEAAAGAIRRADLVMAQLEVPLPAVEAAARLAGAAGVPFLLNPAPARSLPDRLLRQVDTLVPNRTEAEVLTGEADAARAAEALRARGCRRVVVTLGAKGVLISDASGVTRIAARKVRPVDTVGAGDCFCAWLGVGLAAGMDLRFAAGRAAAAAAVAVTRPGAQPSMPRAEEVRP